MSSELRRKKSKALKHQLTKPEAFILATSRYKYNFFACLFYFAMIAWPLYQLISHGKVEWGDRGVNYRLIGMEANIFVYGPVTFIVCYLLYTMYKVWQLYRVKI